MTPEKKEKSRKEEVTTGVSKLFEMNRRFDEQDPEAVKKFLEGENVQEVKTKGSSPTPSRSRKPADEKSAEKESDSQPQKTPSKAQEPSSEKPSTSEENRSKTLKRDTDKPENFWIHKDLRTRIDTFLANPYCGCRTKREFWEKAAELFLEEQGEKARMVEEMMKGK